MLANVGYSSTEAQMEKLAGIVALATENAACGLSGMLGRRVTMTTPLVTLAPITRLPQVVGPPDRVVVGVYLYFVGDASGYIALILQYEEACQLVDALMDLPTGTTMVLGDLEQSALGEAGNVAGSYFLNALAEGAGLGMRPSPPGVLVDLCGAVLDVALVDLAQETDEVLVIETVIRVDDRQVTGHFLVLPRPDCVLLILQTAASA